MNESTKRLIAKRSRARAAFSLVEVAMTIIIMATLSGIAIPRFAGSLANQRANATVNRIKADLERAQKGAKFSSSTKTIQFNPLLETYTIIGMSDINRPGTAYVVKLKEPPYNAEIVGANFDGDNQLIFNGYGVPDSGGTITIRVAPFTKTINVQADTAEVSVP